MQAHHSPSDSDPADSSMTVCPESIEVDQQEPGISAIHSGLPTTNEVKELLEDDVNVFLASPHLYLSDTLNLENREPFLWRHSSSFLRDQPWMVVGYASYLKGGLAGKYDAISTLIGYRNSTSSQQDACL